MNHSIYSNSPSWPLPQRGQIIKLYDSYYMLVAVDYKLYGLVGLLDGNRWAGPTEFLTWDALTTAQSDQIVYIWPDIKSFLKDVNL